MDFITALTLDLWTVLGQSIVFGVVLAIGVRIALEVLAPANASTRFAVWFATLVIIAAFPLVAFLHSTAPEVERRVSAHPNEPERVFASPLTEVRVPPGAVAPMPVAVSTPPIAPPSFKPEYPLQTRVLVPADAAAALLGLYGFAVFLLLSRLAISYLRLRRLKRNAFPAPSEVCTRFETWRTLCKTARPVRLLLTSKARSPMAVGFSRPAVVIPEALLLRLTREELDHLGLHELAHVRRSDDWTNLTQKVIQALFFFNPAVLWICRRLDFEREVACDDWVLTITGQAKPYARSLTKVLEATPWRRGPVLASGAVFRKQQIIRRIEMLLDGSRDSRPNVSHVTLVVILMCILGAFSQMVRMPAFVAFGDDPPVSFQRSRWNVDGRTIETEIRGAIRFAEDDISVESMSPGGYVRVKETSGWTRREVEIRDDAAQPKIRYLVDGRERPLDEQGRTWMGTILPMIIRESGIDAEARAGRILKKRGAAGVFDEVDRISSGHSRRRYLGAVIASRTLTDEELRRAMNRIGRIEADHEKATLLAEVAGIYSSEQLRGVYFDAIDSINSDHNRRSVLSQVLEDDSFDAAILTHVARSIEKMQSDHDKAQLLQQSAPHIATSEPEARRAMMRATASINSDHDKGNVLNAVLHAGPLPAPALEELLRVAVKVQSDHDKARVLEAAAQQDLSEAVARSAYFAAARTIDSDHDRARILSHVMERHDAAAITDELAKSAEGISSDHDKANVLSKLAPDSASTAVLSAVRSINSDSDKRRVLEAMLERSQSPDVVKGAVEIAGTINSDHEKAKVLEAIAGRHGDDPAVRDAVRRAAEKIGSDSDYRRIVSKLFADQKQ